ncbi:hypothetical protein BY458DRAFT_488269 [Sporodiniella umbellata]|nr:hypothetical protein BY458DRAFT_488269 [Sporodiniella umbellata]
MSVKNITENLNRVRISTPASSQSRPTNDFSNGHRKSQKNPSPKTSKGSKEAPSALKRKNVYRSRPLPSDDEDDVSSDEAYLTPKKPLNSKPKAFCPQVLRQTRSDGSAHATFNLSSKNMTRSAEDLPKVQKASPWTDEGETIGQIYFRQKPETSVSHHICGANRQPTYMSGMDLLLQREQERAEAKRQNYRRVPDKITIKGLLGRLPEPGTHNISFQQLQFQQQHTKKTSSKMAPSPVMYNPHTRIVPNTYYPTPHISFSHHRSVSMNYISRPLSATPTRYQNRKSNGHSIPFV